MAKGKLFAPCEIKEGGSACGKRHHRKLHGTTVASINVLKSLQLKEHKSVDGALSSLSEDGALSSLSEDGELSSLAWSKVGKKELGQVAEPPTGPELLQIEIIDMKAPDGVVQEGVNFWDSSSSVCLITYSHAARLGLEDIKCLLHVHCTTSQPQDGAV